MHTCALLTYGGVDCWGDNGNGQLGTGDTSNRPTPTAVTGLGAGEDPAISHTETDSNVLISELEFQQCIMLKSKYFQILKCGSIAE